LHKNIWYFVLLPDQASKGEFTEVKTPHFAETSIRKKDVKDYENDGSICYDHAITKE
jgi:hypothetical protein